MKYIIDLDGTILTGLKANRDSVLFIKRLQSLNHDFLVMTNSVKSPCVVVKRLKDVGLEVKHDQIMNPISTINDYIKEQNYKKVYTVGSPSEIDQVEAVQDLLTPDLIVLLDFEKENVTYNTIQSIVDLVESGVPIVAASGSLYYLSNQKKKIDTGSFLNLIENITGQKIEVFGKPSKRYFSSGIKRLNSKPEDITVIGDDHLTDIKGARALACSAVLIQSGKYKAGDEKINLPTQCVYDFSEIVL